MKTKITIVTIVLNDKIGIEKTMLSVLNQSYSELEYIIKDGKSSDGTSIVIDNLTKQYEGPISIKHINREDKNIYDAMNQALYEATSEWIIFLNSGDVFVNNDVLKRVVNFLESTNKCDMICGDTITDYQGQYGIWRADINHIDSKFPGCHQSMVFKTEICKKYPFNLEYIISSDFNMVVDIYSNSYKIQQFPGFIACYSLEGISANKFARRIHEYYEIRRKHGYSDKIIRKICKVVVAYIKDFMCRFFPRKLLSFIKRKYAKAKYGDYKLEMLNKEYNVENIYE